MHHSGWSRPERARRLRGRRQPAPPLLPSALCGQCSSSCRAWRARATGLVPRATARPGRTDDGFAIHPGSANLWCVAPLLPLRGAAICSANGVPQSILHTEGHPTARSTHAGGTRTGAVTPSGTLIADFLRNAAASALVTATEGGFHGKVLSRVVAGCPSRFAGAGLPLHAHVRRITRRLERLR